MGVGVGDAPEEITLYAQTDTADQAASEATPIVRCLRLRYKSSL